MRRVAGLGVARTLVRSTSSRYGERVVRMAFAGLLGAMLVALAGVAPAASRAPGVMLWAWERPEDLAAIDPTTTGVAFLARTIRLDGAALHVVPRRQPLGVPPGTFLVAVVRVEPGYGRSVATTVCGRCGDRAHGAATACEPCGGPAAGAPPVAVEARVLADAIAAAARPGVAGVQVDFDAPRSLRPLYRATLRELRSRLPPTLELSMTALASWALGDAWVDDLPVDDVVPMLFRMGADARAVRRHLAGGGDFAARRARTSVGLALDEERPLVPAGRRVYLFSARPWSAERAADALAGIRRWRDEPSAAR